MAFTCGKSSGSGGRNSVQCWLHNGLLGALGTAWSFLGLFFCLYNGTSSQVLSTPPYSSNRYNPQSFLRDSKASFSGERPIFRTIKMSSHYLRKWVTTRDRIELSAASHIRTVESGGQQSIHCIHIPGTFQRGATPEIRGPAI